MQPRLISGLVFATARSCGWWVFIVLLPIYAIENGLSDRLGSYCLSLANASLFFVPLMSKILDRTSVKISVKNGFFIAGLFFILALLGVINPWLGIASLCLSSVLLIFLDICGNLPFFMAVKPSERTEMSAVFSSYRDISGIISPGIAWIVLLVLPVSGVFVTCGVLFGCVGLLATKLPDRLGKKRAKTPRS